MQGLPRTQPSSRGSAGIRRQKSIQTVNQLRNRSLSDSNITRIQRFTRISFGLSIIIIIIPSSDAVLFLCLYLIISYVRRYFDTRYTSTNISTAGFNNPIDFYNDVLIGYIIILLIVSLVRLLLRFHTLI